MLELSSDVRSGPASREMDKSLARHAINLMLMAVLCPMLMAAALLVLVRPENGLLGTPERLAVFAVFAIYSFRAGAAALQLVRMRRRRAPTFDK